MPAMAASSPRAYTFADAVILGLVAGNTSVTHSNARLTRYSRRAAANRSKSAGS